MANKSYYFTLNCAANDAEIKENKKLGFIFVNGQFGESFNRDCDEVAGFYPEHLKDKLAKGCKRTVPPKAKPTSKSTVKPVDDLDLDDLDDLPDTKKTGK